MRLVSLLLLVLSPVVLSAADIRPVERFGLFVGANEGQPAQPRLRWAVADAQKMAAVMIEAGGIARRNATVLGQPSGAELLGALRSMRTIVQNTKAQGRKAEFYFYYSGHSDERGLLLGRERVLYSDLRKAITNTEAEVNVAILDSCDSGAFTRSKGGERVQPFLTDLSSETTGYAFLTSSSENEASQESDLLGGSFFTYYFINGLRGAADIDGNKRVTLNQAYQYAFRETLAQTEGTSTGAQHASYDFQLKGSGDLVIVDLTNHRSSVLMDPALAGRIYVRDQKGALVSELQKDAGKPLTLAIPAGTYTVRVREGELVRTAKVTVTEDSPAVLNVGEFAAEAAPVNRSRGDGTRKQVLFDIQVLPGTDDPPEGDTTFSLGLLGARVDTIRGVQMSGVVGVAQKTQGVQMSGVVTVSGTVQGAQMAGVYAQAGDVGGWQASGVVAIARDVTGVQSSGAVNIARNVDGAQVAVFNKADTVRGLQLGVFNYADDVDGISLGLVSWVTHGIHEIEAGYDFGAAGTFVRWKGGSRLFWTSLEFGVQNDTASVPGGREVRGAWFDSSLGFRFEAERWGIDWGLGLRRYSTPEADQLGTVGSIWEDAHELAMVPHLDVSLRAALADRLVIWGSPRLDYVDSRLVDTDRYRQGQSVTLGQLFPGASVCLSFSAGLAFKL